ncbi:hypothetical protein B0A48_09537 [Cryoendolithus antarcticus]|uniref:Phosducin thioredoxin-like domain-containing protein n=1 Tax=Cryoendolithus antarcticus TaxID=1507870 RepID=A0A1V8SZM0_9PEZI|nr:hypothetical protein B0A48_09537 [Cryoendolithus antarcticus]
MPSLDAAVAKVLDRHQPIDSDDEDALIAELEDDDTGAYSAHREKRLEQLHAEVSRAKMMQNSSHGTYQEIKDEKQLMDITTSTKLCVVHFMKPDFNRCRIMDEKLRPLAEKHFDTRFVLPCVIAFVDAVGVDRIIGFEGLGAKPDSFTLSELEGRLMGSGVLVRAKMTKEDDLRKLEQKRAAREAEYDDDEWD